MLDSKNARRVMGIDYGSKRVGIAVSDETRTLARAHSVLKRSNKRNDLDKLSLLVTELGIEEIVFGLPKNMDGSLGPAAQKALEFANDLATKTGKSVIMQDERLSTVAATRTLIEAGMRRAKRKQTVDRLAAQVILQTYLDRVR